MNLPAGTIWDTRIQCVCGVIVAREAEETQILFSANFGQVTASPPRIIINPNRLYAVEGMIRRTRRFSLNLLTARHREATLRLVQMRRRERDKAGLLGWRFEENEDGIPFFPELAGTLFCEVEAALDTGDHTVMISRVLGIRKNPECENDRALLYREVSGDAANRGWLRDFLVRSPFMHFVRAQIQKRRGPPPPVDLPGATYQDGGQTDEEIAQVLAYGVIDRGLVLSPPPQPRAVRQPLGVCVVGTHWGLLHCELVRKANPQVRLFVCGRDEARTARLAGTVKADGYFIGIEAAARDQRVQAMTLAIPHHLHREAAETALANGKHVLVEKPIATTLEDADAMIAAATRAGKILMVAENMHFRPALAFVAKRISLGNLGEPLQLLLHCGGKRRPDGWMADREKAGGGVLMDSGVHYVRAMRLLFGEPDSATVFPNMRVNTKITGEDGLQVVFTSRYGWNANLLTTWSYNYGNLPDIVVFGDRGSYHIWSRLRYVDYYPATARPLTDLLSYVRPYWLQAKLMHPNLQRVRIRLEGDDMTGYSGEVREFLAAVCEEREPVTSAADGRRDLEIVLRAYDSLRTGERAAVPGCASAVG